MLISNSVVRRRKENKSNNYFLTYIRMQVHYLNDTVSDSSYTTSWNCTFRIRYCKRERVKLVPDYKTVHIVKDSVHAFFSK